MVTGDIAKKREKKKRGCKPHPIVPFPVALFDEWTDPPSFVEALDLHMRRHGDSTYRLHRALEQAGITVDRTAINSWRSGRKLPNSAESVRALSRIESRYRLAAGYFKSKLISSPRSTKQKQIEGVTQAEQRRLSWHLPDDFEDRPKAEQQEILAWVRRVIISGATEYRQYQAAALRHKYGLRFPSALTTNAVVEQSEPLPGSLRAPAKLVEEMAGLLGFKTATLTPIGFERNGVWGEATAAQKIEHLSLLFGALAASPDGPVKGRGVANDMLTFALLVFPSVWDWYLQWRQAKRGFYTAWEVDMLSVAASITRARTGWLRQTPQIAAQLQAVSGLLTDADITQAKGDWGAACERLHTFANARSREIQRIARVHRDPFEPILVVLESPSPVGEYRKIAEEILRLMPDESRYPVAAAEAVRAFLIIRLGLHLGVRQRNLRELMFRRKGESATPEKLLVDKQRGELRWSERDGGWEVFIPSVAFKNKDSSFFSNKPFRLLLPDLAGLYNLIDAYLTRHRARLLAGKDDPGTFFVKTMKASAFDASYDQNTFYDAWRLITQRYGIYNPYTGRGAIRGMLPHGPHSVRDVLATHVLKATGSYEQASYAIQDTPDVVAKHYGRFLPQDKAALAARVLNKVWEAA